MVNLLAQKLGPYIRVVDHLIIVISGSQAPVPQMFQSALRPSRDQKYGQTGQNDATANQHRGAWRFINAPPNP
jgi:hypothetical protein